MADYSAVHSISQPVPEVGLLLTSGGAARPRLYEFSVGCKTAPSDEASEIDLQRTTAAGSGGSTITEGGNDPDLQSPNAAATGGTFSGNPTLSALGVLYRLALNKRATFRWIASPMKEFVSAAASGSGFALNLTAQTSQYELSYTMLWSE